MKNVTFLLITIYVFFAPQITHSTCKYDEKKGVVYIGGNPIDLLQYRIKKLEKLQLQNRIYEINTVNNEFSLLVKVDDKILEYEISQFGYIAVSIHKEDTAHREFKNSLVILDKKGKQVESIEDVVIFNEEHFFSWSPDGERIVYIKAKVVMEDRQPFRPLGVFIYDVEKDETVKISDTGVKVNWSKHDNNIHIQNKFDIDDPADISVFNTKTGKLSKSKSKGIIFSDDGKYCYGLESAKDIDNFPYIKHLIFDNSTNKVVYKFKGFIKNARFIEGTHKFLMWGGIEANFKIFAVDKQEFIRSTKKYGLLGWNKDMTKVVVYEGGNKIHIDELLTGTRWQSIDIPK